jgi:hypothetical protein
MSMAEGHHYCGSGASISDDMNSCQYCDISLEKKMTQEVSTFSGSHNMYARVGIKGGYAVGLSVQYAIHPIQGTGYLFIRFVSCGTSKDGWTTLKPRDKSEYTNSDGSKFEGRRLLKTAFTVFDPGPSPILFLTMGDKFNIWEIVADWVKERLKENGVEETVSDLKSVVRDLVSGKGETEDSNYHLVLQLPDLQGE